MHAISRSLSIGSWSLWSNVGVSAKVHAEGALYTAKLALGAGIADTRLRSSVPPIAGDMDACYQQIIANRLMGSMV